MAAVAGCGKVVVLLLCTGLCGCCWCAAVTSGSRHAQQANRERRLDNCMRVCTPKYLCGVSWQCAGWIVEVVSRAKHLRETLLAKTAAVAL